MSRNLAAATTLIPLSLGFTMAYVLHCTFRRRMLYTFSTFLAVFLGRELTMNRGSYVVIASFVVQFFAFVTTIVASDGPAVEWATVLMGF